MTGAPKRRTCGILAALEAAPRGPYAGCLGYIAAGSGSSSSSGSGPSPGSRCDFAVIIRTAVAVRGSAGAKGEGEGGRWEFRVGAGGAVLYASDPAAEFDEMLVKADAVVPSVLTHPIAASSFLPHTHLRTLLAAWSRL
ncbi:hypothetical protein HK405_010944 [Cladochytrium tenue]|nr:hypothetical protein HK405_010944 [Cladochytrium tenue]